MQWKLLFCLMLEYFWMPRIQYFGSRCIHSILFIFWVSSHLIMCLVIYVQCFAVLCSRAENVSNFIQADAIFGPVGTSLLQKFQIYLTYN
jgi:hypothetical protein